MNLELNEDEEVVLYRFDNGMVISRILGPLGLLKHLGHAHDYKTLKKDRHAIFALDTGACERDEDTVVLFFFFGGKHPAWNMITEITDSNGDQGQWSLPYWAEFAQELLIPHGELPEGDWGGAFRTPFWIDDAVYTRMDPHTDVRAATYEDLIRRTDHIASVNRRDERLDRYIEQYMHHVFADRVVVPKSTDRSVWVRISPPAWNEDTLDDPIQVRPMFEDEQWVIIASYDRCPAGRGRTLLEAFQNIRFDDINFRPVGSPMPSSMRDEWLVHDSEGYPTFDPRAVEPYFLLGQDSPLLMPGASFVAWWKTLVLSPYLIR